MHRTIEGTYEKGRITLAEKPAIRQSLVKVTFLDEIEEPKLFKRVPSLFLNPLKVSKIRKFSREELHAR